MFLKTCQKKSDKNVLGLRTEFFKISFIVPVIELLELFIFNTNLIILMVLKNSSLEDILNSEHLLPHTSALVDILMSKFLSLKM